MVRTSPRLPVTLVVMAAAIGLLTPAASGLVPQPALDPGAGGAPAAESPPAAPIGATDITGGDTASVLVTAELPPAETAPETPAEPGPETPAEPITATAPIQASDVAGDVTLTTPAEDPDVPAVIPADPGQPPAESTLDAAGPLTATAPIEAGTTAAATTPLHPGPGSGRPGGDPR
jgi:hypothetical protein